MARKKSEWELAREGFLSIQQEPKTFEEREHMPEKPCGKCKNFSATTGLGSAGGHCFILKTGSNITSDPPVFVLEGEVDMQSDVRMDASKCKYYEEMELVDTDIGEAFDPRYSRHQRPRMK